MNSMKPVRVPSLKPLKHFRKVSLLKMLSDENISQKAYEKLSDSFELYELSYLNEESMYERKKATKRSRNSELIMTDESLDFKIKAKAMAMQIMNNKYSKKNVAAFVDELLGDKKVTSTRDFEISDDDAYIMTLLSVVQANDKSSEYTIEVKDEIVQRGAYEIPLIIYKRRNIR